MKNSSQLKAGVLLSYGNLAISTLIPLLYTPVMLQILGQAEYGLYSLSNSVISYLSLLTLGLGGAIVRYLMKYRTMDDKQMLERTAGLFVLLYAVIALAAVAVGIGITFFTDRLFAQGLTGGEIRRLNLLIVLMAISSGIAFLSGVYASISVCYERYLFRRILEIAGTVGAPLLNLWMLYAGYASIGMAVAGIVLQTLTLGVNIWYCVCRLDVHPSFRHPPVELLRDIFGFSAFIFVGMIADLMYWATDKVLIGAMVGTTAVAVYNIGSTFNSILQSMSAAISGVFSPRVNRLVFSDAPTAELSALLIQVGRIQYLIVSLALSGFIVFGQSFLLLWAGDGYQEAYSVALLTMLPLAIPLIQNIAFTTIVAQNNHRFRSVLYVVLAAANVVGTYFLIPLLGITGAALCTCGVFLFGHGICMNWFYYKRVGLDIPRFWHHILKMTPVPAGMAVGSFLLRELSRPCDTIWTLLAGILVYTVVFCILSWLFTMNRYEKNLILGLFASITRKRKRSL